MYNERDRNIKILDRIDINDYIKQFIFHMEKVGIRRFNPRIRIKNRANKIIVITHE